MTTTLAKLDDNKKELLSRTLCVGASDDEMELFFSVCERTGLDPFARQIYAVKRWDSRTKREVLQTQVSIDGFRLVAQRSGEYAGQTAATYCGGNGQWTDVWLSDQPPVAARIGVYRKGFVEAVVAVALFREYAQRNKEGGLTAMWARMPTVMIAKCAEALALRKCFPAELSGLYTAEEMAQADNPPVSVSPSVTALPSLPSPAAVATRMAQDQRDGSELTASMRNRVIDCEASTEVAATSPPKNADSYPDEYSGVFLVSRVVRRPGKDVAIQAHGDHGAVWIATNISEYADIAQEAIGGSLTLDIARVGHAMTITRVVTLPRKLAVATPADEVPL